MINQLAPLTKRLATYQDVLDAPANMVAELLDDGLVLQPRPAMRHALAVGVLGFEITGPFMRGIGGPGGRWIVAEPELHLADAVMVPDLAGWRRERMPAFPDTAYTSSRASWQSPSASIQCGQSDRS